MVFKKGQKGWNKGLTKKNDERVRKSAENMKGISKSESHKEKLRQVNLGKKYSKETNQKKACPGEKNGNFGKRGVETTQFGKFNEESPNWKGGKSSIYALIRYSSKYSEWRRAIFDRDNFTCQHCHKKSEGDIEAHHINILREYNITNTEQAYNCPELWFLENGITLCINCHKETDNYGNKKLKQVNKEK